MGLVFRIATPETNLLWLLIAVLLSTTTQSVLAATNDLSSALQKGLFEEEANRNLDAAIASYQSLVGAFDKDRKIAATAVFRLGEVYRKQGRTNEAAAQYERIVQEFSDQATLVTLSRQNLAGLGTASPKSDRRRIDSTQPHLSELQTTLQRKQGLLAKLKPLSFDELKQVLPTTVADNTLTELLGEENRAEQTLVMLQKEYEAKHPKVIQQTDLLEHIRKQIRSRVKGILDSMELQIAAAKTELEVMSKAADTVPEQGLAAAPLPSDIAALQASLIKKESLLGKLKPLSLEDLKQVLPTTIPDASLNELLKQEAAAEQNVTTLSVDFTPEHPSRKAARALLDAIEDQIQRRTAGIIGALELQVSAGKAELDAVAKRTDVTTDIAPTPVVTDPEEQEIRRIQAMIRNSPDLINAPQGGSSPLFDAASAGQLRVAAFLLDNGTDVNLKLNDRTPLHAATFGGQKTMVDLLLSRGADANAKDGAGRTPLHAAAQSGFVSVVETLLQHKADVNARDSDKNGQQTPLHLAAANGHQAIVKLLVANSADVNSKSLSGDTPLLYAAASGHRDTAAVLLDAKADVNGANNDGRTPLHAAAEAGHLEVVKLLLEHKANVNARNKLQATPLLLAVNGRQTAVVNELLEHDANPDLPGTPETQPSNYNYAWSPRFQYERPVYHALARNNIEVLALLLDHGADPDGSETKGWRPLTQILPKARLTPTATWLPLYNVYPDNDVKAIELLLAHKADPNKPNSDGNPPLCLALYDSELVKMLLQAGADPDSRDKDTVPALVRAAQYGYVATAKLLIERNADVNAKDKNLWTALHWAAVNRNVELTKLLLASNVDLNPRFPDGTTPLQLATQARHREVMELLLSHNPDVNTRTVSGQTALDFAKSIGDKEVAASLANLLREHGALDDLPDFTTIRVMRQGLERPIVVFRAHTNGWNRFTLLETMMTYYVTRAMSDAFVFPDLSRLVIRRPSRVPGDKPKEIRVNLLNASNHVDCASDMPLEFGDLIEIPERDHALSESVVGITPEQQRELQNCTERKIRFVARGESLTIGPSTKDAFLRTTIKYQSVQSILRSSSDISHIKVKRTDFLSGKMREILVNITENVSPHDDLWLRDGDVIEVPEK